jgi:branched-chain amino acid transport system permease protein
MNELSQHLVNAVVLGSTYALIGVGRTLIFGIMRLVNFTHGELYSFGAYMMFLFVMVLKVDFFVAILLAIGLGVLLGALIEFVLLRPLRGADMDTTMLVLIALWIIMQNTELLVWSGVGKSIANPFPSEAVSVGPVSTSWLNIFVFGVAGLLILGSHTLIRHTKFGRSLRATFQDRETAALMGVNSGAICTATFAFGSGLAAAAGALLGPVFLATPTMGDLAALKAFAIVILGGLGNFMGATLGGFILAFVEEMGAGYISSGYRDAMGFLLIIIVLLIRPTGLFARVDRIG